jgi:glutamate-1-semialdehyde 2,1-aminomutase
VLTEDAFDRTIPLAERFSADVSQTIDDTGLPWHVTQLGCRAEYRFRPSPPRTGAEAADAVDVDLDRYVHVHALNRGVLLTPFHNMALMSPATTLADVETHSAVFARPWRTYSAR